MVDALRSHARRALEQASHISGLSLGPLEKNSNGAPLPSKGNYWSLSHKTANVAAVVATHPIGIDIEFLRPCNPSLHQRIADEREWQLAQVRSDTVFFRFWTAKEAVLKAVGMGMTGLKRCRIHKIVDDTGLELTYDGSVWPVSQYWTDDDHLVAVTGTQQTVHWHVLI